MRADLDRGAVGVSAGWPNGDVAQQAQTVTGTTGSLVQPRTGCVLHKTHTHTHPDNHQYSKKNIKTQKKGENSCHKTKF